MAMLNNQMVSAEKWVTFLIATLVALVQKCVKVKSRSVDAGSTNICYSRATDPVLLLVNYPLVGRGIILGKHRMSFHCAQNIIKHNLVSLETLNTSIQESPRISFTVVLLTLSNFLAVNNGSPWGEYHHISPLNPMTRISPFKLRLIPSPVHIKHTLSMVPNMWFHSLLPPWFLRGV